jgi:hypothetical protein
LKPPSCLPVTFEPTKAIFEFSGVIGSEIAPAVRFTVEEFDGTFEGADVCALNLLAAGSSQAANNKVKDRMTNKSLFITKYSPGILIIL